MTFFDLREIQSPTFDSEPGAVIEIDFYHASTLLALTDDALVQKAHQHLKKVRDAPWRRPWTAAVWPRWPLVALGGR